MTGLKKSSVFESGGKMGLDFQKQNDESFPAMRSFRTFPFELLLPADGSESGRYSADESDRRAIYEDAVLREPEDGCVVESPGPLGESEADSEIDARDGDSRHLSRTQYQPASYGACCVSVSSEKSFHRASQPGLERRHHIHPALPWFCVSGGDTRLVFSICSGVETFELSGDGVLYGSIGRGFGTWESGYFQHGSGLSVHERGFYETAAGAENPNQHGLAGTRLRQYFQRETLEERQIRGYLSKELSNDDRGSNGFEKLFSLLQPRKIPSGSRLSNTARDSWNCKTGREVIHIFTVTHKREKKEAKKEREKQAITTKIIV